MAQDFPNVAAEEFRRFGDARSVDLFEGALLVARLIDPAADLEKARARVAELAVRVAQLRAAGTPALDALRHVALNEPFRWSLREGAKGVQLAELGMKSWKEGRWVEVPKL